MVAILVGESGTPRMRATTAFLASLLMPVLMAAPGSDSGEDLSGPEAYLLMPVVLSMAGIHYLKEPFVKRFSKLGSWESSQPAPDGGLSWVGFEHPASVVRGDALVKPGRYRVEGGKLYIAYVNPRGGSSAEELVPITGVASSLQQIFRDAHNRRHHTYPPVTIGWEVGPGARTITDFRPDGTCRIVTNSNRQQGKFEKTGNGIRVRWTYPPQDSGQEEDWTTRRTSRSLFITHNGVTVEYKRIWLSPNSF